MEQVNHYDGTARYALKMSPTDSFGWLCRLRKNHGYFVRWLDAQTVNVDGVEKRMDCVARLENPKKGGQPWALILEIKKDPDGKVVAQVANYEGRVLATEKPDKLAGSAYLIGRMVINLTGRQGSRPPEVLDGTEITSTSTTMFNLVEQSADEALQRMESGDLGLSILPWVVLMDGNTDPGILARWQKLFAQETDKANKADYAQIARTFAEAADVLATWLPLVEYIEMVESPYLKKMTELLFARERAEAEKRVQQAEEQTKHAEESAKLAFLIGQIQMLQRMLKLPISDPNEFAGQSLEQLTQLSNDLQNRCFGHRSGSS